MSALLKLHVNPRGSKNEISGWRDDALCVKITAPPVDGAANAAVVKFIAGTLGVRKSAVRIISGEKSREKTIEIDNMTSEEMNSKIGEKI